MTLPKKIHLREELLSARGLEVPESAFRVGVHKFDPKPFSVGGPSSRMREKHYGKEVQEISLQGFLENPLQPSIYGVASQRSPEMANFFCAYLAQEFMQRTHGSNKVLWVRGHQISKDVIVPDTVTMLVLSGLTPNTPKFILDKVANMLDRYDTIPRVVSIVGEDPITFFALYLYTTVHRVFFHTDRAVAREVEVV